MLEYKNRRCTCFLPPEKYFFMKMYFSKRWLVQYNYIKIAFPCSNNSSHNIQFIKKTHITPIK